MGSFENLPYTPHIILAENDGTISYSKEFNGMSLDFRRQPNGLMTYFTADYGGKYYVMDVLNNVIDSFYCGNGYSTDFHELVMLNNGHFLLMSYDPQPEDMSIVVSGGNPNAIVTGLIIQELDENKNVVFQWRSSDHFNIVDAIYENLTDANVDYAHGNAIDYDFDGNLLISCRHLSEITKINRST